MTPLEWAAVWFILAAAIGGTIGWRWWDNIPFGIGLGLGGWCWGVFIWYVRSNL